MYGYKLSWVSIEKLNVCALLIDLIGGKLDCLWFSFTHVPASNLVDISQTT